jgi:endonuclease/exonuclease/phosphatase family metal-dependent hydrolase
MTGLRVLSLNLRHGTSLCGEPSLEDQSDLLGRSLSTESPNVVLLQECDRWTERSGKVDQPGHIASQLGMSLHFCANLDYQGGQYGTAILTDLGTQESFHHLLPMTVSGQRTHIDGTVHKPERRGLTGLRTRDGLLVICVHASIWEEERLLMMRELRHFVDRHRGPLVIGGDFNTDEEAEYRLLGEDLTDTLRAGGQATFPAGAPLARIDRIFTRGLDVAGTGVVETHVSDHYLVRVDLLRSN